MDCCKPTQKSLVLCPQCGAQGKAVSSVTVSSMLSPEMASSFSEDTFTCKEFACPVLYYGSQGLTALHGQARVKVSYKDNSSPRTLCYCFRITDHDAQQEIETTSRCTIPERICALIREGRCDCERQNPAGVCCLGEVRAAVANLLKSTPQTATEGKSL